jgi:hypothetical protein
MPRLSDSDYAILAELERDARPAAGEYDPHELAEDLYAEAAAEAARERSLQRILAEMPVEPWPTPEEVEAMAEQMGGNEPITDDRVPESQSVEV